MFNILWVCGYWQSLEIIRLNSRFAVGTHFRVKTVIIIFSFGKYAAPFCASALQNPQSALQRFTLITVWIWCLPKSCLTFLLKIRWECCYCVSKLYEPTAIYIKHGDKKNKTQLCPNMIKSACQHLCTSLTQSSWLVIENVKMVVQWI